MSYASNRHLSIILICQIQSVPSATKV